MFGLGIGELMVILVIFLVVFGTGKLGDVGGDLGRAIKNFRKAVNEPEAIDVTPKGEADKKSAEEDQKKA